MSRFIADLRKLLGDDAVLDAAADLGAYRGDWALPDGVMPLCVVRPRSSAEVAAVVERCAQAGHAIVPRGGGTGLAGGASLQQMAPQVVLSFERMRRIRSIDAIGNVMVAEAGCALQAVQEAAREAGRLFGIEHGGAGSSQLGGNLSTNAGGNNVLRYGMARQQVLGLEVVLADGSLLDMLRPLPKNNAGYDLNQLFMGSEGTLGLITAAALRLRPAPVVSASACVGLDSLTAVMDFFVRVRAELGELVSAFEVMPRTGVELHFRHSGERREPLDTPTAWLVLMEADSASRHVDLQAAFEALLESALADGLARDAVLPASEAQRRALWRIREGIAVAMIEAPAGLKSDTAVPVDRIPAFVEAATVAVQAVLPGCVPVPFGHVGDGNIHFNVLPPEGMAAADFKAVAGDVAHAIEDVSIAMGGTVSAEHGIGWIKRAALQRMRSAAELDAMARLKAAFDPLGLLNPGKVLFAAGP